MPTPAHPAEFLYDNLAIEANIIQAAWKNGVEKLLLLGSSCIYPKLAPQPITEEALLTGPLEPTNEWYAVAKIAGIKLVQAYRQQYGCDFISAMPTNLYGPGDNYDLSTSHVLPALDSQGARGQSCAATGRSRFGVRGRRGGNFCTSTTAPTRSFISCRSTPMKLHINVGCGEDLTIVELARLVCKTVGFDGEIVCDPSKPDGTPRKLLSVERLQRLGWTPRIGLE